MMESNEKQVSEQSNGFPCECVPAPASIEQAYELGWRWRRESFVGLDQMRESLSVITKREGLAHFVSEVGNEGIIIPFAATYDFGAPRYPKYPYAGGSVYAKVRAHALFHRDYLRKQQAQAAAALERNVKRFDTEGTENGGRYGDSGDGRKLM
jgi:hypothetical protein